MDAQEDQENSPKFEEEEQEFDDVDDQVTEAWRKEEEMEKQWSENVLAGQAADTESNEQDFEEPAKAEASKIEEAPDIKDVSNVSASSSEFEVVDKLSAAASVESVNSGLEHSTKDAENKPEILEFNVPEPARKAREQYVSLPAKQLREREQQRLREDAVFLRKLMEYKIAKHEVDSKNRAAVLAVQKEQIKQRLVEERQRMLKREAAFKQKQEAKLREFEATAEARAKELEEERQRVRNRIMEMDMKRREKEEARRLVKAIF